MDDEDANPCDHKTGKVINCFNDFLLVTTYCTICKIKLGTKIIYGESIIDPEEIIRAEDSVL